MLRIIISMHEGIKPMNLLWLENKKSILELPNPTITGALWKQFFSTLRNSRSD